MINLRQYLEVLKPNFKLDPDIQNGLEDQQTYPDILIGYLTRVLYNKEEGLTKALEKATDYVVNNWESIANDWNNNLEYKEETEKKDGYASLTKLYE